MGKACTKQAGQLTARCAYATIGSATERDGWFKKKILLLLGPFLCNFAILFRRHARMIAVASRAGEQQGEGRPDVMGPPCKWATGQHHGICSTVRVRRILNLSESVSTLVTRVNGFGIERMPLSSTECGIAAVVTAEEERPKKN